MNCRNELIHDSIILTCFCSFSCSHVSLSADTCSASLSHTSVSVLMELHSVFTFTNDKTKIQLGYMKQCTLFCGAFIV